MLPQQLNLNISILTTKHWHGLMAAHHTSLASPLAITRPLPLTQHTVSSPSRLSYDFISFIDALPFTRSGQVNYNTTGSSSHQIRVINFPHHKFRCYASTRTPPLSLPRALGAPGPTLWSLHTVCTRDVHMNQVARQNPRPSKRKLDHSRFLFPLAWASV